MCSHECYLCALDSLDGVFARLDAFRCGCKHAVRQVCAQSKCDVCDSYVCAQCDEAAYDCPRARKRPALGAVRKVKRARCE
jgi:hypothetical protein